MTMNPLTIILALLLTMPPVGASSCGERAKLKGQIQKAKDDIKTFEETREAHKKQCEQEKKGFDAKVKSLESLAKESIGRLKKMFETDPDRAMREVDIALGNWGLEK